MASNSQSEIEDFSRSDEAPEGEWWAEFLVGLSLEQEDSVDQPVNRRIDGLCVTSREPSSGVERLYKDEMREKHAAGWLDGEEVVLVEHGRGTAAWAKYGQLDVRRRMFEMDWERTAVKSATVVMEVGDPETYGRGDTRWMFENDLGDYEYMVEFEGGYHTYGDFIDEYCCVR